MSSLVNDNATSTLSSPPPAAAAAVDQRKGHTEKGDSMEIEEQEEAPKTPRKILVEPATPLTINDFMRFDFVTRESQIRETLNSPWKTMSLADTPARGAVSLPSPPTPQTVITTTLGSSATVTSANGSEDGDEQATKKAKTEEKKKLKVNLTPPFFESCWRTFEPAFRDVVGSYELTDYLDTPRAAPLNFYERAVPKKSDTGVSFHSVDPKALSPELKTEHGDLMHTFALIRSAFSKHPETHPANTLIALIGQGNPHAAWKYLKKLYTDTSDQYKKDKLAEFDKMTQTSDESVMAWATRVESLAVELNKMSLDNNVIRTIDDESMAKVFLLGLNDIGTLKESMLAIFLGENAIPTHEFEHIVEKTRLRALTSSKTVAKNQNMGEQKVKALAVTRKVTTPWTPKNAAPQDPTKVLCRKCLERGHGQRGCKSEAAAAAIQCTRCKTYGHLVEKCYSKATGEPAHNRKRKSPQ